MAWRELGLRELDGKTGRAERRKDVMKKKISLPFHTFHLPVFPSFRSSRLVVASLVLVSVAGCNQTPQAVLEQHAANTAEAVQKAAEKTAMQTWDETVVAARTGGATLRVKTALTVSSRMEGARIDVELQGNKIVLRGVVLTQKQKAIAQSIAVNTLDPKFKVVNKLTVVK
jgi:osmotically-inducible protein OsmY